MLGKCEFVEQSSCVGIVNAQRTIQTSPLWQFPLKITAEINGPIAKNSVEFAENQGLILNSCSHDWSAFTHHWHIKRDTTVADCGSDVSQEKFFRRL